MTKLLILLIPALLIAQEAKAPEKPKPPAIPAELRAKFWRKQSEYVQAQTTEKAAALALQEVVKELQTACSTGYIVSAGADGEPTCQPIPKPEKK